MYNRINYKIITKKLISRTKSDGTMIRLMRLL